MKPWLVVPAVVALLVTALLSRPAQSQDVQDTQKGAALFAEARKAIGGDDKLRAVKTLQSKGTYKRTAGTNTQEGDVEILIELPNKYRRNELSGFAGGPTQERIEVSTARRSGTSTPRAASAVSAGLAAAAATSAAVAAIAAASADNRGRRVRARRAASRRRGAAPSTPSG